MSESDTNQRLERLETKVLLLEDLVDTLNRTIFRQHEQLDLLQAQLRLLYRQVQNTESNGAVRGTPQDEVPPHY